MDYSIVVENLNKELDGKVILENINLKLKPGRIYGFIGRNGSGKSMLFKVLCGFLTPNKGKVIIYNEDIYNKRTFPKKTRALIENPSFISDLSGFDNLKLLADIQKIIGEEEINNTLKVVNLFEEKNKKFGKYSLGMKQKLGIASVLMENPDIMILDEPFNGIDNNSIDDIRKSILSEKKLGKTILLATHVKSDIELLCDEIFELDCGKLVDRGN
jgi:ABC-2 type transport system ATP-binding protein